MSNILDKAAQSQWKRKNNWKKFSNVGTISIEVKKDTPARTLKMILKDKVKPCLFCGDLLNHVADRGSGIQERNTCDYRHNGRNYLFTRKLETLQGMIGPERQQTQMQFDSKKIKKKVYVFRMERLAHLEYFIQICYWKMISRYPTTLLNDELKTHFRGKLF